MLCTCNHLEHAYGCPALSVSEPQREAMLAALGELVEFYALACDEANGWLTEPAAYALLRNALYPASTVSALDAYRLARQAGVAYGDHKAVAQFCLVKR